jgi:hypothetical protein
MGINEGARNQGCVAGGTGEAFGEGINSPQSGLQYFMKGMLQQRWEAPGKK